MFPQRTLLYIKNFDFSTLSNKSPISKLRDKYIVVVENNGGGECIFCCFTTRLSNETEFHENANVGCNNSFFPYNVFHFAPFKGVTDSNFIFPDLTFIAGNKGQLFKYDLTVLSQKYQINNFIEDKGIIHKKLFFDVIHCLSSSFTLEGDVKEHLFEIGNDVFSEIQSEEENFLE